MHKALARAVEVHDKIGMATQLIRLAQSRLDRGLVQGAEECLNKAMDVEQSDKGLLPVGISGTLYSLLGTIHAETYRHNSAMTYLGRALHLMEGERAPKLLALCVEGAMKMADIQFFRGKYPEAEHLFRKALNACQSGGRKELEGDREAEILFRLAEIYDMNGSVQKALSHYQASLALDEAAPKSMNRAASCASTLANMGAIHVEQQAWSQAEDCFRRSLRWDRQANNREGMHKTLLQLADIYLIRRQYPFAERVLKQALALALQANRNPWKASTYLKLGDLSLKLAKPAQALEYYASARKVAFGELSEKSLRLIEQKILEARRAQSQ
jgi:tetratricopeptide (TPR) repeat protein